MKHGRQKISEAQMVEEVQGLYSSKRKLGEACANKWSKTKLVGPDLIKILEANPLKAYYASIALQNQEKTFKKMSETVYSTAFPNNIRPETMLKAVFLGHANSKRGDIFTEYPLTSTDDALFYIQATYEQALRGATAGSRTFENINYEYAGEQITGAVGVGNGVLTNFVSAPMAPLPLIPFKTRILVNGAQVAVDNGSGTLVGAALNPALANTVVYETGVITLNFLAAPANNAVIQAVYNWNSEDTGNYASYGTIGLELIKTRFNARPMPLGYRISDMTQIMFETTGLGDAMDYMAAAVAQEHARARDYKAIAKARNVALGNAVTTFNTDFAAAGEISFKSHAQRVTNVIDGIGSQIYDVLKRGGINKIVAGAQATTYFKNHELWVGDNTDPKNGVYKSGTLDGMEVYTCPADAALVASNEALLVYKNPQEGLDVSIVFGTLREIDASLRYPNFETQGNTAAIEDSKVINPQFVRLLRLQGI